MNSGDTAPNFSLPGSDQQSHALSDFRGNKVLVYFYPKDETPGCTKEACGFRDLFEELQAKGVRVVGISPDPIEDHQAFIRNHNLPFVLLSDEDRSVMTAYGAWGEKKLYGKTVVGAIRSSVLIDEGGKVIKHWARVPNAAKHPESVLKVVEALGG
jgi:peroxiredoxin Q/BCP